MLSCACVDAQGRQHILCSSSTTTPLLLKQMAVRQQLYMARQYCRQSGGLYPIRIRCVCSNWRLDQPNPAVGCYCLRTAAVLQLHLCCACHQPILVATAHC